MASALVVGGRSPMTLHDFNAAEPAVARELLGSCLDIARWVREVEQRRPYPDGDSLRRVASASSAEITWAEVAGALARHPRIGERATGPRADAALSASEQAGARATDETVLAAGNAAYEQRFGYIFLISATGLTGAQMLAELRDRLTHTDSEERPVVMDELRKIAALRLDKAVMP